MASKTTSTTASNIRSQVSKVISNKQAYNNIVKPLVSQLNNLNPSERNSRLLKASTAMYRASTESGFKPKESEVKDYAAAMAIIAEKRGIKPQKNGDYPDKNMEKELSPKEMMKFYAASMLNEENTDEDTARTNITNSLKDVYESDQINEDLQDVVLVSPNQANIGNKPDSEFMSMSEEDQNAYMANLSDLDKEHLQKLLADKAKKEADELAKKAGRFEGFEGDQDWGHKKDDDNFKIEQGDIIDYMMKEIILASAAWVGNKAAGLGGIIVYELSSYAYKKAIRPMLNKASEGYQELKEKTLDGVVSSYHKLKDRISGDKDTSEEDAPASSPLTPEQMITVFKENRSAAIEDCNKSRRAFSPELQTPEEVKKTEQLQEKLRQLSKHYIVLGEDSITYPGKTVPCDANTLRLLKTQQGLTDDMQKIRMIEDLKPQNDAEKKQISDWYNSYTTALDNAVKENKTTTADLQRLEKQTFKDASGREINLADAFDKAVGEQTAFRETQNMFLRFSAETDLFATHYASHKFFEELKANPNTDILTNEDAYNKFVKNATLEGKVLFWQNEQQRIKGNPALSREQMIETAEAASKASEQDFTSNNNTARANPFARASEVAEKSSTEKQSFIDAATKALSVEDVLTASYRDCNDEINRLNAEGKATADRRDHLDKTKDRINNTKSEISKTPKGNTVNLSQIRGFNATSRG